MGGGVGTGGPIMYSTERVKTVTCRLTRLGDPKWPANSLRTSKSLYPGAGRHHDQELVKTHRGHREGYSNQPAFSRAIANCGTP